MGSEGEGPCTDIMEIRRPEEVAGFVETPFRFG